MEPEESSRWPSPESPRIPAVRCPKPKPKQTAFLSSIRGEKTAQVPGQCGGKNAHRGVRDGALYGRGRVSGTPQRVKHPKLSRLCPTGHTHWHSAMPKGRLTGATQCYKKRPNQGKDEKGAQRACSKVSPMTNDVGNKSYVRT